MEVVERHLGTRRRSIPAITKEYCRLCLIKFESRFMIPIFSPETKRLEHQIRAILKTIEMSQGDTFSNCVCIECALKVSTAFNFTQFCDENQKLLRSSHFNLDLLVEATDTPVPAVDSTHLEDTSTGLNTTLSPARSAQATGDTPPNRKRRRRSTATAPVSDPVEDLLTSNQEPSADAEEDDRGMALPSSMLECHLDEGEQREEGVAPEDDEEEAPKGLGNVIDNPPIHADGLPPSNPYRCSVCFREFGKKANVLSHFQTQHTNLEVPSAWKYEIEPAKCPLCGDLVECLFAHLEYHAQRRTFKCDSCEWAFYSKNYLNIHTNKLHKTDAAVDAKPDRFLCKLCPPNTAVCRDYDALVAHYRQWHLNEMKGKLETCQQCGKETRYLRQHMEKAHGAGQQSGQNQFQCHLCDKSYGKSRYLQTHFTTAHKDHGGLTVGQVHVQAQPMDYSQPSQKAGKRPRQVNPGGPVHCVKCQMQFPNNRMLNMHIQRYHNANIHSGSPPRAGIGSTDGTTTTAEVSVTAIPASAGPLMNLQHLAQQHQLQGAAKKRRRDSVPVVGVVGMGGQKDLWNNSALSGMLVNMFGMHGHYED